MKQLTREQAFSFGKNHLYEGMTARQKALFQLNQNKLCMPFPIFHEAVEQALGRPVFTHEFAKPMALLNELCGEKPAPTFEEIINMIPVDKRVIISIN